MLGLFMLGHFEAPKNNLRLLLVDHFDALVWNLEDGGVRPRRHGRLQDLPHGLAEDHVALVERALDRAEVVEQVSFFPVVARPVGVEVVVVDVDDVGDREDALLACP